MKLLVLALSVIYPRLLYLFPKNFREQFGEEMGWDFSAVLQAAGEKGLKPVLSVLLREARDLPGAVLQAHLEQFRMQKLIHSQPVNHAVRGAVGFGAAFALAGLISTWAFLALWAPVSVVSQLQVLFFDLFHTEHGLEVIAWIPWIVSSLITGSIFGILAALLFGERTRYPRYIAAGMLGWFLHDAVSNVLWQSFDLSFFLGTQHSSFLAIALRILAGAFLGLIFVVARSEKREPLRWLLAGTFAYPVAAYFYVRLLFKLFVVETPWMFIALMILVIVDLAGIFTIAIISESGRKFPWMVIFGMVGFLVTPYIAGPLTDRFLASFVPQLGKSYEFSWWLQFKFATVESIYGIFFGLVLGFVLGVQKKPSPPPAAA